MDRSQDIREIKEAIQDDYSEPVMPPSSSAPLFVKVDKYREVLTSIQEMKIFLSGLKQIFSVMNEIETMRTDSINILRATMQRLEKTVVEIDTELLRPRGVDMSSLTAGEGEMRHIESSLDDLQKQLHHLKKDLQQMH